MQLVFQALSTLRGPPSEARLVLTDGWVMDGWVMGDGWTDGWAGSPSRKKSSILKISQKLLDIFS